MSDICNVYRETFAGIMRKKNRDAKTLSKISGVHVNTILRLTGEFNPKGMTEERRDKANRHIILKLAYALRVQPQDFSDLPRRDEVEIPAPSRPPLGDHRGHSSARERRRKLSELEEQLLEVAG